ncbi:SHOCT domain-containing protein [Actinoplanes sp. KI2]|uniref:SHOCT domain-containing protein n=1 Tax=Actinoplanes sp. KI2 TaxID=2983315 RepID=UPI0021D5AC77|nr:SHOCT domain-containing protein [Actinoplanes sp. KI2]MCU7730446.1 SHOCT domain-containing protein [Actinoplanes sp. KI2]
MGLLRGVARTAVVAGTATAVSNRVSRRQAGRWQRQADQQAEHEYYEQSQQQQQYPPQQQQYAPPPQQYAQPQQVYVAAPVPAAEQEDEGADPMQAKLDALKQLGELKSSGVLSEQEFQQEKAKILNS